jgi:SAM-dependent methyltransferase
MFMERYPGSSSTEEYDQQIRSLAPFLIEVSKLNHPDNPLGHDDYMRAFFNALEERIMDPSRTQFRADIKDYLLKPTNGEKVKHDMAVQKLERATHRHALTEAWASDPENPLFPVDFKDKESYLKLWDYIYEDLESDTYHKYSYDIWVRDLATNIPQRYIILPLIFGLYRLAGRRFTAAPRVADIGVAQNMGLKKLALGLPFDMPSVMKGKNPEKLKYDQGMTHLLGRLATQEFVIGPSVGIDKVFMYDTDAVEWSFACYRPGEYLDENLMTEYEILSSNEKVEGVDFINVDISDLEAVWAADKLRPHSFDVVVTSMAWYEIASSPKEAALAYRSLRRIVKPGGLIVRHEFAKVDELGNFSIYSDPYNGPYRCLTAVTDAQRERRKNDPITKPFFSWRGGRGDELRLEKGAIDLLKEAEALGNLDIQDRRVLARYLRA